MITNFITTNWFWHQISKIFMKIYPSTKAVAFQWWLWRKKFFWKCLSDNISILSLNRNKFLNVSGLSLLFWWKIWSLEKNGLRLSMHLVWSISWSFSQMVFTLFCGIQARIWKRTKMEINSILLSVLSFLLLIKRKKSMATKFKVSKKYWSFAKRPMLIGQRKSNLSVHKMTN